MTTHAAEEVNLGQAQPTNAEPTRAESTNAEPINPQVTEQSSEDVHYKMIEIGPTVDVNQEFVIKKATIDKLNQSLGRCYHFFKHAYATNRGSGVLSPDQIRFYEQLVKQPGFNDKDPQASLDAFVRAGGQNVKYAMALAEWEKMALQLATGKTIQVIERAESKKYTGAGVVSNEPEGTEISGAFSSLESRYIEDNPNAKVPDWFPKALTDRGLARAADKISSPLLDRLRGRNPEIAAILREKGVREAEEKLKKQKISYSIRNNAGLSEVSTADNVGLSSDQKAFIDFYFTQGQDSLSLTHNQEFERVIDERLIQITEAQIDFYTATTTDRGFLSQASQEHILNFIDVDRDGNRAFKTENGRSTLEINENAREQISQKIAAKVSPELNRVSLMQSADTARSSVNKYIETLKTNQLTQTEIEQKKKLEQKKAKLQEDLETATKLSEIDAQIAEFDRQIAEKSPKTDEEIKAIERTLVGLQKNLSTLKNNQSDFIARIDKLYDLATRNNDYRFLTNLATQVASLESQKNEQNEKIASIEAKIEEETLHKGQKEAVTDSEDVKKLREQKKEYEEKRKLLLGRKHSMPSPAKIMADIAKIEKQLEEQASSTNEFRQFQQSVYETLSSEVLDGDKLSEIHSRAMEAEALSSLPEQQSLEWNEVPAIFDNFPPCYLRTLKIMFGTEITNLDDASRDLFKKATDLLPPDKFADFIKNYLGQTGNDEFDIYLSEHVNSVSPNLINSLLAQLITDAKKGELGFIDILEQAEIQDLKKISLESARKDSYDPTPEEIRSFEQYISYYRDIDDLALTLIDLTTDRLTSIEAKKLALKIDELREKKRKI